MHNSFRTSRLPAEVLLPVVLVLVPLLITPGFVFYYDVTPKLAVLLLGVAGALPWFLPGRLIASREGKLLCAILAVQAVSLSLSTALSSRVSISIFGTSWRRFGWITQLTVLLFTALATADLMGGRHRFQVYLRATVTASIPISLYGIGQYFGWDPWLIREAYHVGDGFWTIVRPPGTLGYVSYFANYMVFVFFLGVALHKTEEAGWWKRAGAIGAGLASFAIVLSGSRAALIALAVGGVFLLLWFRSPIQRRGITIAAGAAAVLLLFVLSPAGHKLRSRFRWYQEDAWGGARLLLFRDSLLARVGPSGDRHWARDFSAEFPKIQSVELSRAYPDFYHESPHNILLDALTGEGALGILALLALIALGFHAAQKARKHQPVLAGILGACLAASLTAHQFTVFTVPTAVYFYLVLAMLVALAELGSGKEVRPSRIMMFAAVPVSVALIVIGGRFMIADWELARVNRSLSVGDRASAIARYARVRSLGVYADIWYSNQMAGQAVQAPEIVQKLTAWQQALESGNRAAQTADDPHNAWYNLSRLYGRENQFDLTERALRQAIAASPRWFKPHWTLARVLLTRGRRDEAEAEAKLAVSLNGGKNPEVAETLGEIQKKIK